MEDLVSVIIPVYKVEQYLERCLTSVVNQTYKNLEIILIDDGSPDNCPKMCDDWAKRDSRIKVIHKPNGGLSSARNAGLEVASGNYFGFVDSDDYIELNMYELMLTKLQNEKADICFANIRKVYKDHQIDVVETNLEQVNSENIFNFFVLHNDRLEANKLITDNVMASVWRTLYKRTAIGNLRFDNVFCEDIVFNVKLINKNTKVVGLSDVLYNYTQRENSILSSCSLEKIEKQIIFYKTIFNLLENKITAPFLNYYKFYLYKALTVEVLATKNKELLKFIRKNDFLKELNTKQTYKDNQKLTTITKTKIVNFLIHHNMLNIYNFIKGNK